MPTPPLSYACVVCDEKMHFKIVYKMKKMCIKREREMGVGV